MNEFCLAYTTLPNSTSAQRIAQILLEKKLIACANILPNMTSIYNWEGSMKIDSESVLILKTQSKLKSKLEETLQEIHPYTCPCLIFLPIQSGSQSYLDWLRSETET